MEVIEDGFEPTRSAKGADIRKDLPRYKIFREGEFVEEIYDVEEICTEYMRVNNQRLVSFLIGCSFTFEAALIAAGLEIRHITE